MIAGSSLKECILAQASLSTTNVEHALHHHIHRTQKAMSLLQKRLVASEQEVQQLKDLHVWVSDQREQVRAPLSQGKKPLVQSNVGSGVQDKDIDAKQRALASTPRALNRSGVGDDPAMALLQETKDVANCLEKMATSTADLETTIEDLGNLIITMNLQCEWLQHSILRDNDCITSAPSRPHATKMYGAAGSGRSSSQASARGGSREGMIPSPPSASTTSTPRATGIQRKTKGISNEALNALSQLEWEEEVNDIYQEAGQRCEQSVQMRRDIIRQLRQCIMVCQNQRKVVVDEFQKNINKMMHEKQNNLAEIESLNKKMIDVKGMWRETSQAAQQMKKPIDVADERQRMRMGCGDHVGNALEEEKVVLRQGRHELKKLCRTFATEMKTMAQKVEHLQKENRRLDDELSIDRLWMTLDNPLSTGMVPGVHKAVSKRQFAHTKSHNVQLGPEKDRCHSTSSGDYGLHLLQNAELFQGTFSSSEMPFASAAAVHHPRQPGRTQTPMKHGLGSLADVDANSIVASSVSGQKPMSSAKKRKAAVSGKVGASPRGKDAEPSPSREVLNRMRLHQHSSSRARGTRDADTSSAISSTVASSYLSLPSSGSSSVVGGGLKITKVPKPPKRR